MTYDHSHDPCKPQRPEYFADFAGDIALNLRKTSRYSALSMTPFVISIALVLLALLLFGLGLFDGANSLGVAMFIGLFLVMPALIFSLLGLLGAVAGGVNRSNKTFVHTSEANQVFGACPNCKATISVDSSTCPGCGASFGEHSAWKVETLCGKRGGSNV